jgi:hypothetical protein
MFALPKTSKTKAQRRYTPSLIGIISGKTTTNVPKVIGGELIRLPLLAKPRRKKR